MKNVTLAALATLAETYVSSPIVPIRPLGAALEANPSVGPQAAHADPSVDAAILKAAGDLDKALNLAKRDIAIIYNRLKPHTGANPMHDQLHMLLAVMQQTHGLLGELQKSVREDLTGNAGHPPAHGAPHGGPPAPHNAPPPGARPRG